MKSSRISVGCLGLVAAVAASFGCAGAGEKSLNAGRKPQDLHRARLAVAKGLAEERLARGRLDSARDALAAFEQTGDAPTQLTLARIDVERGEFDVALRRLDSAAGFTASSSNAQRAELHRLRGACREALGRTADAAADYQLWWKAAPCAAALAAWVDALVLDGHVELAAETLARERAPFAGDGILCELAARLALRSGDVDGALREYRSGIVGIADSSPVARRIAEALMRSGREADSIEIWRGLLAAETDPARRSVIACNLAAALLATNRPLEAVSQYRELLTTDPGNTRWQLGLAVGCLMTGDVQGAEGAARLAAMYGSTSSPAQLLLALCRSQRGDRTKAAEIVSALTTSAFEGEVRELLRAWSDAR